MRAARLYGIGDIRVEEVEAPPPPPAGSVRVKVAAAGICGSDLHNFRTGQWISRVPSVPGHEVAGTVAALGEGVTGLVPGDVVVADSRVWCGTCPACRAGRRNLCASLGYVGEVCDGGFAEEMVLPARLLHRVEGRVDPGVAAMAEPLAVALHAVAKAAAVPEKPALVVGCGPIGGLAALVLARRGCRDLLIADRNAARRDLVAAVTGGRGVTLEPAAVAAALDGAPLEHAVEATGSVAALEALLDVVSNGSTVALVGIAHGSLALDPNRLVEREVTLAGCSAFADELPQAVALLPELAPQLARLIDAEIGLAGVPEAYRRLVAGEVTGLKVVVRPDRG
ncbi:zinc-dependent alcohol dehydrogenase [Labrys wisconsinensis]|uniref:(R,R)-butanediol dehydrogenase/meso-butanediol dehydrogenase/diacetyl reductase n=1 Tax=Labrys wisconsinensis TaxID=425677 RepID=A0ABU0J7S7_9HYPH|nr:alcohol dehydrogenase catalytic domain-containing protein [Labrys wisconsinensis]MDQ0469576.1 (R,R)-butanediol dehydrogenase/meso-butanediol dehydrogenase/diacetyl reductase [Labrys wisconsinensis]